MADTEKLGGISVDVDVNDAAVEAALTRLEQRLAKIVEQEHTINIKLTGGGELASTRAKKNVEVPAEFKFGVNATRKMAAELFKQKPLEVNAALVVKPAQINALKKQLIEAFSTFEIPVRFKYGGMANGQMPVVQVAGGPGGPGPAQEEQEVAGSGRIRTTRTVRSGVRGTFSADKAAETLERAVATMQDTVRNLKMAPESQAQRRELIKAQGQLKRYERMSNMVAGGTSPEVFEERYPKFYEAVAGALGTREARPRKRTGMARKPIRTQPGPVSTVTYSTPEPIVTDAGVTGTTTGYVEQDPNWMRRLTSATANRTRRYGPTMYGPEGAALEAAEARRQEEARLAGSLRGNASFTGTSRRGGMAPGEGPMRSPSARGTFRAVNRGPIIPQLGRLFSNSDLSAPMEEMPSEMSDFAIKLREAIKSGTEDPSLRAAARAFQPRQRRVILRNVTPPGAGSEVRQLLQRYLGLDRLPSGATRRARTAAYSGDVEARFERGANPIQRQYDPRGPYPQDPFLVRLAEIYRKGGFGTAEQPQYQQFDDEDNPVGKRMFVGTRTLGLLRRRGQLSSRGLATPGTEFMRDGNRYKVLSPREIVRRYMRQAGQQFNETDLDKMEALMSNPGFKPSEGGMGGGYKGVSTGYGPAARSIRDTPAGNLLSQQRIEATRDTEDERAELAMERARRRDLPAIYGPQRRIHAAVERYRAGYAGTAGLEGFFGPDQEVTPRTTFGAWRRKFEQEYRERNKMRPGARLPEAIRDDFAAGYAVIRDREGGMVRNYDAANRDILGNAPLEYRPGSVEAQARQIAGRERINPTTRPANRQYTPAEERMADLRQQLVRLEGNKSQVRAVGDAPSLLLPDSPQQGALRKDVPFGYHGPFEEDLRPNIARMPGSGTDEERRAARNGNAMQGRAATIGEIEVSKLLLREARWRRVNDYRRRTGRSLYGKKGDDMGEFDTAQDLVRTEINAANIEPGVRTRPMDAAAAWERARQAPRKARAIRRYLPWIARAAAQERGELLERGVNLEPGRTVDDKESSVLTGDQFQAKMRGEEIDKPATIRTPEPVSTIEELRAKANERIVELQNERAAKVEAGTEIGQIGMFGPEVLRAAEEREGLLDGSGAGGGGGERSTSLSGGGIVKVHVTNFSELKGNLFVKGEKPPKEPKEPKAAKATEEVEGKLPLTSVPKPIRGQRGQGPGGPGDFLLMGQPYFNDTEPAVPKQTAGQKERARRIRQEEMAKAAEEKEASLASKAARAANRSAIIRELGGFGFKEIKPDRVERQGKTEEDIQAEADILEARSLNPTRAFQTAMAAAAAKTFGGGGAFEKRVKELTDAISQRRDVAKEQRSLEPEMEAAKANFDAVTDKIAKMGARGKPIPDELLRGQSLFGDEIRTTRARQEELEKRKSELDEEIKERRSGLITKTGVVRGFAALGVGAIGGGMVFSAATAAMQTAVELVSTQLGRAADAAMNFAMTAQRVTADLAQAVRGAGGDVAGGISGVAAGSGISLESLSLLRGKGLDDRASAIAAAQNRVQESDLFRSANFLGGDRIGGYDRALFQGTGGVLGGSFMAPQPGFMERIADDIRAFSQPPNIGPNGMVGGGTGIFGMEMLPSTGTFNESGVGDAVYKAAEKTAEYLDGLNGHLIKVNSQFRFLETTNEELLQATADSAAALGQADQGKKLYKAGVAIVGPDGAPLQGTQYGQAASELAAGQNMVDPRVAFEQSKRAIEATIRSFAREQENALDRTLPVEAGLANLAAPARPIGSTVQATSVEEQAKLSSETSKTRAIQADLNAYYDKGKAILKSSIPEGLYNSIQETGQAIVAIQTRLAKAGAALQAAEYSNQLRIARRTLGDIAGLSGKSTGQEATRLGLLQRQNVEYSRQAEMLQMELQQRQINFQLAIAGFQAAGESPEERAARMKDAKTQAEFAQRQLDLQKKMFGVNIKIFNEENLRAATDAMAAIGLLEQGRALAFDTALAEEQLDKLNKKQEQNLKQAGAYLQRIEKEIALASGELLKLETAYGKALIGITESTINGFINFVSQMTKAMPTWRPTGAEVQPTRMNAEGFLGTVSGATNMIMGEAGTETVAILRNPRAASLSGMGGGGGVTININGPVVREESDIRKIASEVEKVLNTRTAMLGLR